MFKLLKFLKPYIWPYMGRALAAVLLSIPLAGIKVYQASLVKPIFDKGLSGQSTFDEALILAAILFGLGFLNYPCRFFHFYFIRYVVDRATCGLRNKIYDKLQRLPLSYFNKSKQGVLISNTLNDTQVLSQGFRGMVDLIREPLTALGMLTLALIRDWQLTIVIFIVAPMFIWIFQTSGKKIRNNMSSVQKYLADMTHNASEGLIGQKIAKAFNLQDYVHQRFVKSQEKYFESQMQTTKAEENAHPIVELIGALAFSGVIIFAHHRISTGQITQGDFVSFVTALALLMDPIRKFSQANVKINQARAAADRIYGILDLQNEQDDGSIEEHVFSDKIEIKSVTFSYGEGVVLRDFSLTIEKGQKVALVGLSGSGKTTLVNLLLRLYEVEEGEILIDGIPIQQFSLSCLRQMFGLVSQDIFLFHDTVRENLCVGSSFSDQQIQTALEIANAKEFVDQLTQGTSTIIGDRGTKLSGGQGQRLTIARAFLKDSPILLFDEATSALDNESEKLVQQALERLAGSKTVVAVAHRLSTIQNYDKIVVLQDGKKLEEGTHGHLLGKGQEYSKLYQLSQRV